jgi:hypothetical protein
MRNVSYSTPAAQDGVDPLRADRMSLGNRHGRRSWPFFSTRGIERETIFVRTCGGRVGRRGDSRVGPAAWPRAGPSAAGRLECGTPRPAYRPPSIGDPPECLGVAAFSADSSHGVRSAWIWRWGGWWRRIRRSRRTEFVWRAEPRRFRWNEPGSRGRRFRRIWSIVRRRLRWLRRLWSGSLYRRGASDASRRRIRQSIRNA